MLPFPRQNRWSKRIKSTTVCPTSKGDNARQAASQFELIDLESTSNRAHESSHAGSSASQIPNEPIGHLDPDAKFDSAGVNEVLLGAFPEVTPREIKSSVAIGEYSTNLSFLSIVTSTLQKDPMVSLQIGMAGLLHDNSLL